MSKLELNRLKLDEEPPENPSLERHLGLRESLGEVAHFGEKAGYVSAANNRWRCYGGKGLIEIIWKGRLAGLIHEYTEGWLIEPFESDLAHLRENEEFLPLWAKDGALEEQLIAQINF